MTDASGATDDRTTGDDEEFTGGITNLQPARLGISRAPRDPGPERAPSTPPPAASTGGAASSPTPSGTPSANGDEDADEDGLDTPYLREAKEVFRQLVVLEKNLGLYPSFSKVVQESAQKFTAAVRDATEKAGALRCVVHSDRFVWQDEALYSEPEKSKSLAFRIHKDGVRELTILPDVTGEELLSLVSCLKDARKVDEEEDDFITLFWEKDSTHIQIQLADDFISSDDLPDVPERRSVASAVQIQKFKVPKEEKEKLEEALETRREDDGGEATFEISEDEAGAIRDLALGEDAYFPLFDFVDILLEVMVRNPDADAFERSVKMLRTIIAAVIEDLDFGRAASLMEKLSTRAHPGLTEAHLRQLREMLETLTDKQTMTIFESFLAENDKLAPTDPVFDLMRVYPKSALEHFCQFLRFSNHTQQLTTVLIQLGTGSASVLSKHLEDPDPLIVRAMIGVLLETEKDAPVKHIAKALQHPDEKVRVHAAKTILDKGDEKVAPLFVPLLEESSPQLLNLAIQFFAKNVCPDAYDALEALTKSRSFHALDAKRRRMCFKALFRASFSRAIEYVNSKVLRWQLCLGSRSVEKKSAALMALATIDSRQSGEILERFAARKKGPLVIVARRCLKELEKTRQMAAKAAAAKPAEPAEAEAPSEAEATEQDRDDATEEVTRV